MTQLFSPLRLRGVVLKNRIGMSPMCQHTAVDGVANDWHAVHIGARVVGGAGLVCVEATSVAADGRISPGDLGLWNDEQIEPLARIARFAEDHGCVPGIQLAHAGRKGSRNQDWVEHGSPLDPVRGGWRVKGPSPIAFDEAWQVPREMTRQDISGVVNDFVAATVRAARAGFKFLELHAAHGYLPHSFQSPLSNRRTDEFGGDFDNRVRFTLEITRAVREAWPESLPLSVRVSATDHHADGWQVDDTVRLAERLRDLGVDLVDCSSGGSIPRPMIDLRPGYQVPYSSRVRAEAGIRTAAVGMITEPRQADDIVRNGQADLILVGRQLLRDPSWAHHAAVELGSAAASDVPVQYRKAFR
jgi:2,4-dienoyl-CoA reductase-like NADH-dependent reductase (Old Yellow Enzyme family)